MSVQRGFDRARVLAEIDPDAVSVANRARHLLDNVKVDPMIVRVWTRRQVLHARRRAEEGRIVNEVTARFDRWLAFLPKRMVPRRVQTEVVGDGIESIATVVRAGGSTWAVRLVYASVVLTVFAEIIRFWARALKGEKARK
jgi:hypothetical protein